MTDGFDLTRDGEVARLTFTRPAKMNAITYGMWSAIPDVVAEVEADPADVRAMADANLRYLVAGPERDISVLPAEMVALVREMCEQVYRHDWTAPQWTERIPDTRHRLAEITTPALVIIGTADARGLVELSRHLAESLPDAELVELADTGHLPAMERPDEVTGLLRKFL